MKKIDDWFFAGLIAGIIGGLALNLYCLVLIVFGVPTGTYWQAMGGLFYNKKLLSGWLPQIHGVIDSIGVSGANGILTCLIIKYSGNKYFYIKSLVLSALGAYFLYLSVYPQTGLGKDNPFTPWVALFGHVAFLGLLTGFILKKIYPFEMKSRFKRVAGSKNKLTLAIIKSEGEPPVATDYNSAPKKKCNFRKPKKL